MPPTINLKQQPRVHLFKFIIKQILGYYDGIKFTLKVRYKVESQFKIRFKFFSEL